MKYALTAMVSSAALMLSVSVFADADHHAAKGDKSKEIKNMVHELLDENQKYVKRHKPGAFAAQMKGQTPRATVVTCSDSRVHTTALDATPEGDLFMIRNIGNQMATGEGSVEYGVRHLNTPLLLIVGHSSCGAVKAAMGDYSKIEAPIKRELDTIKVPGKNASNDQEVQGSVEANVNSQVAFAMKKFDAEVKAKTLAVVGAVYDFRNDYKQGHGKLVIVNANGETDQTKIKQSPLLAKK